MRSPFFQARISLGSILFAASFWLIGCSATENSFRSGAQSRRFSTNSITGPPETIVLPVEAARSVHTLREFSPFWNVTTNHVNEALGSLPHYLLSTNRESFRHPAFGQLRPDLRNRLNSTLCQAVSITLHGQRAIFLNCFPAEERWAQNWERAVLITYDTGPRFWSVIYVQDQQSFTNLWIDLGY